MGSDICVVNGSCTHEWRKGWPLRSGGFAQLCCKCGFMEEWKGDILDPFSTIPDKVLNCGCGCGFVAIIDIAGKCRSAYENSVFCNKFHCQQTGWRECNFCNKPIHCGCIVSRSLFEYLDFGGIGCVSCVNTTQLSMMRNMENPNVTVLSIKNNAGDRHSAHFDGRLLVGGVDEGKLMQFCKIIEASESSRWNHAQRDGIIAHRGQKNQEAKSSFREVEIGFSNVMNPSVQSLTFATLENNRSTWEIKNMHESNTKPSLSMYLGNASGNNSVPPSAGEAVEGRLDGKTSPPFQGSRSIFPKPLKNGLTMNMETNKGTMSQSRVARPPADGRGKNQLLPRYWPRITDEELERLAGDLKSTVVPLFEKVLSASDAGRIGRLVLPKACAEAYFPPISQSEGVPLRMQDVKGNEWTFQFRFWPNNNSRMYVLEGVTPCIQAMQLCAGDTVTFSRIDPGGKLVMGFRKASNSTDTQDASTSAQSNLAKGTVSSGTENLPSGSNNADLLHSLTGNVECHLNGHTEHLHLGTGTAGLLKTENNEMTNSSSPQQQISVLEKKRTRNIGPKSKRLLIDNEDAMELKLTWEEAQDLLRPPPSVKPSIVTIEDQVIEEYDEPPVFGKRTIFSACSSGGKEQWAQCDDCSKWRKLPVDALLPPKWTCCENVWDSSRCSCSAPEELSSREIENLLKNNKDFKKRRIVESSKSIQEHEPSGLDALASAAVLGENLIDTAESSAGVTTKHPRHRPGCSCIVCIQPPSGKGRHKPTCTCNVCMTVKRRFKTLMLRKKKRQSEREADAAQKDQTLPKDELDTNGASRDDTSQLEKEAGLKSQHEVGGSSAGQIDLNSHPNREDMQVETTGLNMSSHLEPATNHTVGEFMNQNGLRNFNNEVQTGQNSSLHTPKSNGEGQRYFSDGRCFASIMWNQERKDETKRDEIELSLQNVFSNQIP
ncbi:B3 domain-containing transcription repressor VAL1 isoform X2 [Glycine soja]|uniref:B3 domain-containing transcription repressor VAL1 isoform B n=1 Tax=Glycine soja TaxID=3848 RepID=A0A445FPG1_GLYSO|nr:B3 domain-containing transcription repressor VAL1 isoform X2 [Glycine soja]RZB50764.1 B3 domain-containing transcription repressor VAL1 isoform B [Glycine soja]